jgi:hypothetical protein
VAGVSRGMMCLAGCGKAFHFGAVVSILDSHRRDPGSIPCNVTFCPNLEIVTQEQEQGGSALDYLSLQQLDMRCSTLLAASMSKVRCRILNREEFQVREVLTNKPRACVCKL